MARRLLARLSIREESFLRRSQASNSFQEEEHFSLVQHVICGSHKSRTLRGEREREEKTRMKVFLRFLAEGRTMDWNGEVGAGGGGDAGGGIDGGETGSSGGCGEIA